MPKQSSIQLTEETRRQIEELAQHWGLSGQRNTTEVMTRCIERIWMLEIGFQQYQKRAEHHSVNPSLTANKLTTREAE